MLFYLPVLLLQLLVIVLQYNLVIHYLIELPTWLVEVTVLLVPQVLVQPAVFENGEQISPKLVFFPMRISVHGLDQRHVYSVQFVVCAVVVDDVLQVSQSGQALDRTGAIQSYLEVEVFGV